MLAAGCGGASSAASSRHVLTGMLHLAADGTGSSGEYCAGSGGYSDISGGTQVTVANQSGAILAVGQLDPGQSDGSYGCNFLFEVLNVPAAPFYEVTVSHRGNLDYSAAQMAAMKWNVQISLGGS